MLSTRRNTCAEVNVNIWELKWIHDSISLFSISEQHSFVRRPNSELKEKEG